MTPPVRCLPPGHYLTARPGGPVESFRYWRPVLRPAKSPAPETPERILAALRDSVAAHLRSDVPVGAFLSGGVDSAAICALAAQTRPGLQTFTAGFARPGYSEIEQAQETAAALGLRTSTYVIRPDEFAARAAADHLAPRRPDGRRGRDRALVRRQGGAAAGEGRALR